MVVRLLDLASGVLDRNGVNKGSQTGVRGGIFGSIPEHLHFSGSMTVFCNSDYTAYMRPARKSSSSPNAAFIKAQTTIPLPCNITRLIYVDCVEFLFLKRRGDDNYCLAYTPGIANTKQLAGSKRIHYRDKIGRTV